MWTSIHVCVINKLFNKYLSSAPHITTRNVRYLVDDYNTLLPFLHFHQSVSLLFYYNIVQQPISFCHLIII